MNTYKAGEFAAMNGVCVKMLQRWDRIGKLKPDRTASNRRVYTDKHLAALRSKAPAKRDWTIVYCRVSSAAQKPDLVNQRKMLEEFCAARGYAVSEWVVEIGGGMNFKRAKFLKVMDAIADGLVTRIVIAHKDRLARFGVEFLAHVCDRAGCEMVVLNTESLSPEREMVEDLMAITDCFSARLNGLRNYRKALSKAVEDDTRA